MGAGRRQRRRAALLSLRELVGEHDTSAPDLGSLQVGMRHFEAALQEVLAQRV